jgi:hypothetical protein
MLKKAQDIKEIIERFKQELRKFNINSNFIHYTFSFLELEI